MDNLQPQGDFEEVGNLVAQGANHVNPQLLDILNSAAKLTGMKVQAYSGYRPGDPRMHGKGLATDVRIIGPDGKPLPNYQTPESFSAYEKLAQAARQIQQDKYPDLGKQFRWGGYFSGDKGKYGALDLMHFDLGGSDKLGMAGGSWDKGLTAQQAANFPGVKSQGAMAFAPDKPSSPAADAVNAMAGGTLPNASVRSSQPVDFVPPPFSGQEGHFTPLVSDEELNAPQQVPDAPDGTPDPASQGAEPSNSNADDYSDELRELGLKGVTPATQTPVAVAPDDYTGEMKELGLDGATAQKETPTKPATADAKPNGIADITLGDIGSFGNNVVRQLGTGAPIIGGALNKMDAATNALIAPVINPLLSDKNKLAGGTWSERYANSLNQQNGQDQAFETDHPIVSTGAQIAGGVASTIPLMAAAPGLLGAKATATVGRNALLGGTSGIVMGGADGAVRSDGNLKSSLIGAGLGGAGGVAGPVIGKAAGYVGNKLMELASGLTPKGAAAQNLATSLASSDQTVDQLSNELARNPRLAPMDVDPNLQQMAMNLANQGGSPRSVLNSSVGERAAGATDAVNGAFDDAAGQTPDTVKILSDLRTKQQASVMTPADVKASLDSTMGAASDPQAALSDFVKQRTAAAQPAYEKALQGGSLAPLETQFQGAFADATAAVSQASKDLAAAQQKQLLAAAETSRAGNNVYASSGANAATKEAQAAVDAAQKNLAAAISQKESVLGRLRQAQADGSANAPGAIWSPRIQQFLDEPIMQSGLARGAKIQRLESLSEGKPFDPTDYAITGTDETGNPIVGSVPNMRTLNVAKKGLDAMVSDATDPVTGRLSEEGRAIDGVRRSFLSELDTANPDYKAARDAWAGPSKVMDAFKKGIGLFQNTSGMKGIDNTPEAIANFVKGASPDEVQGLKMGARASLEQQMSTAPDQVDKITRTANIEANQKKLAAIIGVGPAKDIVDGLNAQHQDPVGDAFSRGMDILRNRTGSAGLEDRPEFLQQWLGGASDAEKEAAKQGARVAVDNQINSVRSAAAKGAAIPEVGFNRARLEALLGKDETAKLAQTLSDEQKIAKTNAKIFDGAQTAPRLATNKLTEVTKVTPGFKVGPGVLGTVGGGIAYGMGNPLVAAGSLAAGGVLSGGKMAAQALLRSRDLARNRLMAEAISGSLPDFQNALAVAGRPAQIGNGIQRGTNNLLSMAAPTSASQINQAIPINLPTVPKNVLAITVHPRRASSR